MAEKKEDKKTRKKRFTNFAEDGFITATQPEQPKPKK